MTLSFSKKTNKIINKNLVNILLATGSVAIATTSSMVITQDSAHASSKNYKDDFQKELGAAGQELKDISDSSTFKSPDYKLLSTEMKPLFKNYVCEGTKCTTSGVIDLSRITSAGKHTQGRLEEYAKPLYEKEKKTTPNAAELKDYISAKGLNAENKEYKAYLEEEKTGHINKAKEDYKNTFVEAIKSLKSDAPAHIIPVGTGTHWSTLFLLRQLSEGRFFGVIEGKDLALTHIDSLNKSLKNKPGCSTLFEALNEAITLTNEEDKNKKTDKEDKNKKTDKKEKKKYDNIKTNNFLEILLGNQKGGSICGKLTAQQARILAEHVRVNNTTILTNKEKILKLINKEQTLLLTDDIIDDMYNKMTIQSAESINNETKSSENDLDDSKDGAEAPKAASTGAGTGDSGSSLATPAAPKAPSIPKTKANTQPTTGSITATGGSSTGSVAPTGSEAGTDAGGSGSSLAIPTAPPAPKALPIPETKANTQPTTGSATATGGSSTGNIAPTGSEAGSGANSAAGDISSGANSAAGDISSGADSAAGASASGADSSAGAISSGANSAAGAIGSGAGATTTSSATAKAKSDDQKNRVGKKYDARQGTDLVLNDLNARLDKRSSNISAAIAAGDDLDGKQNSAVWIRGVYGSSVQSPTTGHVGSRANIYGGSIGVEYENDSSHLFGVSYSNMKGKYKYKDQDTADITFNIFSLYAQSEMNNLLLRGMASYGHNKVKTVDYKEDQANQTQKGSFTNTSYAFDLLAGYKMKCNELDIMPFVETRYSHGSDGAYESTLEDGTKAQDYSKQSSSAWLARLGIQASKPIVHNSGAIFTPHMSASVETDLGSVKQKVSALDANGKEINLSNSERGKEFKRARVGYNIGTGIGVRHGNIEMSVDYKAHFRTNYHAHQGSLKLKLYF